MFLSVVEREVGNGGGSVCSLRMCLFRLLMCVLFEFAFFVSVGLCFA